jgi:hypothetical protein
MRRDSCTSHAARSRCSTDTVGFSSFVCFHSGGNYLDEMNQLRTCHRCQKTFAVLSDLFNHTCDDTTDLPSTKGQSQFDELPSTSAKFDRQDSSTRLHNFVSPLSSVGLSSTRHANFASINRKSSATEHIPLFQRPLFQANIHSSNDKQRYASTDYVYLRPSSSPIRVNS